MRKIKIFEINEESLDKLGLALKNHNCRKIIVLLTQKKLPVSHIAKELNIGVNIASDQVKILRELGLLKITQKPIVKKGNDHNYYEFVNDIFIPIIPEENKLKKIFKEGIKFASIVITASIVWFYDLTHFFKSDENYAVPFGNTEYVNSLTVALIIVIIGLVIERIFITIKKKKRGELIVVIKLHC